jgi:hypothetical protein
MNKAEKLIVIKKKEREKKIIPIIPRLVVYNMYCNQATEDHGGTRSDSS